MIKNIVRNHYFTWFLLALPSFFMVFGLSSGNIDAHGLLHPTGEFSARAMLLSLFITPLITIFPKSYFLKALMRRRRYIGLAAFGYALLHLVFYVADKGSVAGVVDDIFLLSIWTGWIAFLILVPLAATSSDAMVKSMGARNWKTLQKSVYIAAIFTAAHWLFLEYNFGPVLVHFVPLIVLEVIRVMKQRNRVSRMPTRSS
jgi:methionine sulfoxide reductase heme-binding subunit